MRQKEKESLLCRVAEAVAALKGFNAPDIPVASVATGFPSGQVTKSLQYC